MTYIIKYPTVARPFNSNDEIQYELSSVGPQYRVFAADPISWSFLAIVFVEAIGKGIGEKIGEGILDALGLGDNSEEELRNYFEQLTAKVIASVKTIVYENELRREHANLSAVFGSFSEYVRAPDARKGDLGYLDLRTSEIYEQISSLGLSALPAFIGASSLKLALKHERYRLNPEVESASLKLTIDDISTRLGKKIVEMENAYKARVSGPSRTKSSMYCERPDNRTGGGTGTLDIPEDSVAEGMHDEELVPLLRMVETFGPAYTRVIDGSRRTIMVEDCRARQTGARNILLRECTLARANFENEYIETYVAPYQVIKQELEKIKNAI